MSPLDGVNGLRQSCPSASQLSPDYVMANGDPRDVSVLRAEGSAKQSPGRFSLELGQHPLRSCKSRNRSEADRRGDRNAR